MTRVYRAFLSFEWWPLFLNATRSRGVHALRGGETAQRLLAQWPRMGVKASRLGQRARLHASERVTRTPSAAETRER